MRKLSFSLLLFFYIFPIQSNPQAPNRRFVFILDASGSMAEKIDGVSRMAIAKDQLMNFLSKLPNDSEVGLVAYGNRIAGCNSARLYQPIQRGGSFSAMTKLASIIPSGSTPIAQTLDLVGEYILSDQRETDIIFISDGVESCEGDPVLSLSRMKARGKKFNLHILGIDLDAKAEEDLTSLSRTGNGKYFKVNKREDMELALLSLGNIPNPIITENTLKAEPFIRIISILPYSNHKEDESYIIHYEYEGLANSKNQLVQLNLYPREKNQTTRELPPLRDRRIGDISQTEIQFQSQWRGKGKLIIKLTGEKESETSLELWSLENIPKIIAKSDIKLLQNFSP